MACIPGEACWMRAGDPLVLHWMPEQADDDVVQRAACGATSVAWRCVDDDDVVATECPSCLALR